MRILFLTNYYPPQEIGGYEQLCRDVALNLSRMGYEVMVLTSESRQREKAYQDKINIFRLLKLRPRYSRYYSPAIEFFLTRRKDERFNLNVLRKLLVDLKPDVVFIWNLQMLPREMAIICEQNPNVAVAYWLAGYSPAEPDEYWRYWHQEAINNLRAALKRPFRRLAIQMMAAEGKPARPRLEHAAVVSQYMLDIGRADETLPSGTQVIYNGVELKEFYRPVESRRGKQLRILQAGRISSDKGVHTSIEAIAYLAKKKPRRNFSLLIAGSGPMKYERSLLQLVHKNQIEDRVTFQKWVPRENMPDLLAKSDVLLLPTPYHEAFSRVVLEAMTSGSLVIGTNTGGTGELLRDEVNSLVFPAENSTALGEQIMRVLDDDELRCQLAKRGQELVINEFSLEVMIKKLEELLMAAHVDHSNRILESRFNSGSH